MNSIFLFEKHSSNKLSHLFLFLFLLFLSGTVSAQVILGFQGGEVGDTWGYSSTGASALSISEATQSPNKVTGTTSLVVGGNTGGGNCFASGSGNGPATARTFTFSSLDISSSNSSVRTLTFNWGNRFPSCNGTGWDSGENLLFTAYHNGVAQAPVTLAIGSNNAQFSILTHSYTWSIPPCVSQFYFVVSVTTNRADELLFIDDVKLTAPQLNGSLAVSPISGNTSVCAGTAENYSITAGTGISYTWSGLPAGASFTTTNGTTASSTITVDWGTAAPGTYSLTVTPSDACGNTGTPQSISVTVLPAPAPITISGPTALCSGQTITLTSSYSAGNTWSPNGETSASISVSSPGTYTVSTITSCGTITASHTVTLNSSNPASILPGGPTSFCPGGSVTLTSESATGNSWSTGETTASITVTTAGTYILTVTDLCGSSSVSQQITILPLPDPQITGNTSFCTGQQTTLTASGGTTYQWSTGETTATISVNTPGNYTVTAFNSCGQATSAPFTVTENPLPNPQITGNTSFCVGQQTTLTASGGTTYQWSTGETTATISVNTPGNYTVTAFNSCGQVTSAPFIVTENPLPNPQITGNTSFCAGQQTTLTASGGTTYQWSTGQTTATISVNTPGNYTVTAFNSCGQATSAPFIVTENLLPNPQITGNTSFCAGQQTTLTASGGTTYQWSTGQTTATISVNTPGNYTVTAFNSCGQATSAPVTITENPLPNPQITGNTSFCAGQQTTLTASGGTTYQWSTGQTTTTLSVNTPGNYTVTAFNSCGQATSAPVTITENPLPNPQITGNTSFCAGQQTTLTASGGTTYQWSTGQTTTTLSVNTPGNYTVTAFNSCGQATSALFTVTEMPIPTAQISGATSFCAGGQTQLTASGGTAYLWSTGETGTSINVTAAGVYTVSAANSCGTDSETVTVTVSSITASYTVNVTSGAAPLSVNFTNTSDPGAVSFHWNFDDGSSETSFSPTHLFTQSGQYTVELTATNALGCSDHYSLIIEVLDIPSSLAIPNVFTPNGDHLNDQFMVKAERIEKYSLAILNRWGNVLLTIEDPDTGWDGTIAGDQAAEGTYFYQVTATGMDKKNYNETGFFELQR